MILNTTQTWGSVAKVLHWGSALVIFSMFVLGWAAVLTPLSPTKLDLFMWHKSIGLSLLGVVFARMTWRMANPTPCPPENASGLEQFLARSGHTAMYACMILMPVSGYVINSTADFAFRLFGWVRIPNIIPADKAVQDLAELVHLCAFWAFLLLICMHIAAALRHHRVKNNNVLSRMLPTRPNRRR